MQSRICDQDLKVWLINEPLVNSIFTAVKSEGVPQWLIECVPNWPLLSPPNQDTISKDNICFQWNYFWKLLSPNLQPEKLWRLDHWKFDRRRVKHWWRDTYSASLSLRQLSVEVRKLVELKTTLVAGTGGGGLIWINVFWKPAWVGLIVELVKLLLGGDSRLVKMFHICQVKIYTLKIVINFEKLSKLS